MMIAMATAVGKVIYINSTELLDFLVYAIKSSTDFVVFGFAAGLVSCIYPLLMFLFSSSSTALVSTINESSGGRKVTESAAA